MGEVGGCTDGGRVVMRVAKLNNPPTTHSFPAFHSFLGGGRVRRGG